MWLSCWYSAVLGCVRECGLRLHRVRGDSSGVGCEFVVWVVSEFCARSLVGWLVFFFDETRIGPIMFFRGRSLMRIGQSADRYLRYLFVSVICSRIFF